MNRRRAILSDLLNASRSIELLEDELAELEWDAGEELVTLNRTHLTSVLIDYLAGRRSSSEIRAWAEAIEGCEDIGFSDEFRAELQSATFQLANPELSFALSPLLAQKIIGTLQL